MAIGDFETQKKNLQEQINTAEAEAGFTLDMSEVEKLNKQLEALEATKATYETKVDQAEVSATENQIKQITELGGTEEELVKREEVQNEKVEEVKEVLEEKSEEVVEKTPDGDIEHKDSEQVLYKNVLDSFNILKKEYGELSEKKNTLLSERNKAEQLKDTKKVEEINIQMTEITEQQQNLNRKEGGIDELKSKAEKLKNEFKKQYGYDESFAKEADKKLGFGVGRTDANRVVINNYLGLELPIFSKDFKLEKLKNKNSSSFQEPEYGIPNDDTAEGIYNKSLLAKKQLETWENVSRASEVLDALSEEDREKVLEGMKENQLAFDALRNIEYNAGTSQTRGHTAEKNISDIFHPYTAGKIIYLSGMEKDKKLFQNGGFKVGDRVMSPFEFSNFAAENSLKMMNTLFAYKIAKEKGVLK